MSYDLIKQLLAAFVIIAIIFSLANLQKPDISEEIKLPANAIVVKDSEDLFTSERNQTNVENLFDKANTI